MGWLEGKVAIITGAGAGIGKAVTKLYLEEGAAGIVAFDIYEDRLATLKEEMGDKVITIQGDVRSASDNRAAVALSISRFGKLDIFIGNAGVRDAKRRLIDLSDEEFDAGFDEVFGINVKGYFLGAAAAQKELARNRGSLIFTLSTSSYYIGGGSIYIAAKHAALGITRALANELAPDIRVNGVAPSGTPTSLTDATSLAPGYQRSTTPRTGGPDSNLMRVQLEPADHAAAYVLLGADQSRIMTGTVINSDGGRGVMLTRVE